ncbi:hypothetical protein PpBr36_01456 [Pyricularia pennisetigena]|uniref:hypothetical protein n=1 Tax=Pyricularia pennisetigena TaxID=1578925 RepID=UPI00114DCC1B|nr:hypothetical protein PpBr36_01456 [Pyricularia pennisetigena]TLS29702.1 hypothetical protein PpBr36_01456 [Pyricularia pennisetigena]
MQLDLIKKVAEKLFPSHQHGGTLSLSEFRTIGNLAPVLVLIPWANALSLTLCFLQHKHMPLYLSSAALAFPLYLELSLHPRGGAG